MFQPVRGTHDLYGSECQHHLQLLKKAREITILYGYQEIITPIFEFSTVFDRLGETSDVVTKETYSFTDRGGELLTLRPEGTAPTIRAILSNGLIQHLPLKLFYAGPMFRYERPQKGRTRQFDQLGVEFLGIDSPQADIEVIAMAAHFLKEINLEEAVHLEINTLGDSESRFNYRQALIDYLQPYKNSLSSDSLIRLEKNPLRILDSKDKNDQEILLNAPLSKKFLTPSAQNYFDQVLEGLNQLGISYTHRQKLVRGLDYYDHTAFEFVSSHLGSQGTVLAGGRYNSLVKMMGGPDLSGVGWAAGVQRLRLLSTYKSEINFIISLVPIGEESEKQALGFAQDLRKNGFQVDLIFAGNLAKRLKRADKINSNLALIWGEEEHKSQTIIVRHLNQGQQSSIARTDLMAYLLTHHKPTE